MKNCERVVPCLEISNFVRSQTGDIKRVLLHGLPETRLPEMASGACHDISVLLAWRVKEKFKDVPLFGLTGLGKHLTIFGGHYVLGFSTKAENEFAFVDGTIWQIKAEEKLIYTSKIFETQGQLLEELQTFYTGIWGVVDIERHLSKDKIKNTLSYLKHRRLQKPKR